jgi:hypothetical protein
MSWVWEHAPVGGSELLVLLAIADCAADDGTRAWPSVATLARKCRVDSRTVQRIIRRLAEAGHLLVEATVGGRGSNVYAVVMTGPEELSTAPGNLPGWQSATGGESPPEPRQDAGAALAQPCHPRGDTAMPPERHRTVLDPEDAHASGGTSAPPAAGPGRRGAANPPPLGADRCPRHLGQPAKTCGNCRGEKLAGA